MILATDGVTEARNRQGHELGLEGLARAAFEIGVISSAQELAAGLMTRIERHTAGTPPHDDVTLFVLRRSDVA